MYIEWKRSNIGVKKRRIKIILWPRAENNTMRLITQFGRSQQMGPNQFSSQSCLNFRPTKNNIKFYLRNLGHPCWP